MPTDSKRRAGTHEVLLTIQRVEGVKGNMYCRVSCGAQTYNTRVAISGQWNQTFPLEYEEGEKVTMTVYDHRWFGRTSTVGSVSVCLSALYAHLYDNSLVSCKVTDQVAVSIQVSVNESGCDYHYGKKMKVFDEDNLSSYFQSKIETYKDLVEDPEFFGQFERDGAEDDLRAVLSELQYISTAKSGVDDFRKALDNIQPPIVEVVKNEGEVNFWKLLYSLPQVIADNTPHAFPKLLHNVSPANSHTDDGAIQAQAFGSQLEEQIRLLQKELEVERNHVHILRTKNEELVKEVQQKTQEIIDMKEKDAVRDKVVWESVSRLELFEQKLKAIDGEREQLLAREKELDRREHDLRATIEDMKLQDKDPAKFAAVLERRHSFESGNIERSLSTILTRLNKLENLDKLDDVMQQLQSIASTGGGGGTPHGEKKSKRSAADIKADMEKLHVVIMDEKADTKDREAANIKVDKLFAELTSTDEYKLEIKRAQEEKARINEPLNQEALQAMLKLFEEKGGTEEVTNRRRQFPALSLIGMGKDQILGKHQSDFNQYLLGDLNITELRAIRGSLPQFRRDQKRQTEFTEAVELKIEQMTKNPVKIPEKAKKIGSSTPVFKRAAGGVMLNHSAPGLSMANLAAELMAKRKRKDETQP